VVRSIHQRVALAFRLAAEARETIDGNRGLRRLVLAERTARASRSTVATRGAIDEALTRPQTLCTTRVDVVRTPASSRMATSTTTPSHPEP
jgi:hypothetical protein